MPAFILHFLALLFPGVYISSCKLYYLTFSFIFLATLSYLFPPYLYFSYSLIIIRFELTRIKCLITLYWNLYYAFFFFFFLSAYLKRILIFFTHLLDTSFLSATAKLNKDTWRIGRTLALPFILLLLQRQELWFLLTSFLCFYQFPLHVTSKFLKV